MRRKSFIIFSATLIMILVFSMISVAAPEADGEFVTEQIRTIATGDVVVYSTNDEGQFGEHDTDTLTVAQSIVIQKLDPACVGDTGALYCAYDTLLKMDPDTGEILPNIITEWDYLDDTHFSFTIRDDVQFHDGTPMTIEDVAFSLQRLGDGAVSTRALTTYQNIDWDNTVIDGDYAMTLALKNSSGAFTAFLTSSEACVLSKANVEANPDTCFWENVVGTGPFAVKEIVSGEAYYFTRNENYWGKKPSYENLVLKFYGDSNAMYIDYVNGVLDIVINASSTDSASIIGGSDPNTRLAIYPSLRVYTICFNESNAYLADENVRKAICMGINVDDAVYAGYDFLASAATSFLPKGTKYKIDASYEYDPEAAHALLQEAGYKDGEISLIFGTNTAPPSVAAIEAIQAMLSEIGIDIQVDVNDMSAHLTKLKGSNGVSEYDMAFNVFPECTLDPDQVVYAYYTYENSNAALEAVPSEELTELLYKGKYSLDDAEREQAYVDAQNLVTDGAWLLPLVDMDVAVIYRDYIDDFTCIDPRMPKLAEVNFVY